MGALINKIYNAKKNKLKNVEIWGSGKPKREIMHVDDLASAIFFILNKLETKNKKLSVIATDLDIIFHDQISDVKIDQDGSTTTSATVLYDLLRKLPSNLDIIFDLQNEKTMLIKD